MKESLDSNALLLQAAEALCRDLSLSTRTLIEQSPVTVRQEKVRLGMVRSFEATIRASPRARTQGSFERKGWSFECSCPARADCWHMLAAAIQVLKNKGLRLPAPFSESSKTSVREPNRSAQPEAGEERESPRRDPVGAFLEQVAGKLGRPLTGAETAYLREVTAFHDKHAQSKNLSAEALGPLAQGRRLPMWELVQLWPAPPSDCWETWLYIAAFLRSRNIPVPEFLDRITGVEELQKLADGWAASQMLRTWEESLQVMLSEIEQEEIPRGVWDLRLAMGPECARLQFRLHEDDPWKICAEKKFHQTLSNLSQRKVPCTDAANGLAELFLMAGISSNELTYFSEATRERIVRLLLNPSLASWICLENGEPVSVSEKTFSWNLNPVLGSGGTLLQYELRLVDSGGESPPKPWFFIGAKLNRYLADGVLYRTAPLLRLDPRHPFVIPAPALRSERCVQLFRALGVELPPEVVSRLVQIRPTVRIRAWLAAAGIGENMHMQVLAQVGASERVYTQAGWEIREQEPEDPERIVTTDTRLLKAVPGILNTIGTSTFSHADESWFRPVGKRFPEEFCQWLQNLPPEIELHLDADLDSLRSTKVAGSLRLEISEDSPDWFDVRVALAVTDTELTREEIALLMQAKGEFVRLSGKGWRRLDFQIGDEDAAMLEDIGINPYEFDAAPQRFHTIQLVRSKAQTLLGSEDRSALLRRAEDLKLDLTPAVSDQIHATLRPYQVQGFHFLVYLSANHFGGILADDMGLGKTLQTLTWLQWLREQPEYGGRPFLVVCPKSVVQNWLSEARRFLPGLRARAWTGGGLTDLRACAAESDLVVVNYTQLRMTAQALGALEWHAIVLDEAQYIKNPASQTAVAACALRGAYRLALSGTPIENRLLDLWSIMQFSMPGLLGLRTHFQKRFDHRNDPLARRRLSARVRPFVMRRTKAEVASDLPPRIEEDLVVEMEGTQALLYSAELKRARRELLKIKTSRDLDKQRFHVLTSLLRLRQICCHPGLVSDEHGHADSAKLEALVDLLEPLMEEGHKVLVFSQFVEMLDRIEREVSAREWTSFLLTGDTENRGELVDTFQSHEGAAVFLISLRAGGMGLNLTAASYVILFDPWWNPAVENQAIDRTHRIGQSQRVIAYRLIAKNSVEQKIRQLQESKCALAGDILGEESLAKSLSMDDFRFLMEE